MLTFFVFTICLTNNNYQPTGHSYLLLDRPLILMLMTSQLVTNLIRDTRLVFLFFFIIRFMPSVCFDYFLLSFLSSSVCCRSLQKRLFKVKNAALESRELFFSSFKVTVPNCFFYFFFPLKCLIHSKVRIISGAAVLQACRFILAPPRNTHRVCGALCLFVKKMCLDR